MQTRKRASVLVYTMILVVLSVLMAVIVLSITSILESNTQIQNIVRSLSSNIVSKGKLSMKYSSLLNTNGTGFIDTIGCPPSVTMSGTLTQSITGSTLRYDAGQIYCQGVHNGNPFKIYFSTWYTDFSFGEYLWDVAPLSSKIGTRKFVDSDGTLMSFSSYVAASDGVDDDFNSDDYKPTSTGNTLYPDLFQDDDANARKTLYGYASSDIGFVNMLWDNASIEAAISKNTYNTGSLNALLWNVTQGRLYIDINKNFNLKLYRMDKSLYDSSKELTALEKFESAPIPGGIGYLQENAWVLSLSWTITGNEYDFDFKNNDYALFVKNNSTGALLFTLRAETNTGSWVYINAMRDDLWNTIRVLMSDIIIDNSGRFLYDQFEVIGFK